jgi:hypothetical protein
MSDESRIASRDWRLHGITTLAAPFTSPWTGTTYDAGTPVEVVGTLRVGNREIHTPVPDAVALYLAMAVAAADRATAIGPLLGSVTGDAGSQTTPATELKTVEREYFDALQELVGVVIFSYSALEAFANLCVPDGHVYRRSRQDGRCTEEYSREQIERSISLSEKLDIVLPAITKAASPKGTTLWARFVALQGLRDRLIHLKPSEWRPNTPETPADTIWSDLVAADVISIYGTALDLIAHFSIDKPRWFELLRRRLAMSAA